MAGEPLPLTADPLLVQKMRLFASMMRENRPGQFDGWAFTIEEWADQVELLADRDRAAAGELDGLADKIDSYCDQCGGDRWVVTADPDDYGEPGEPYQVNCLDSLHACADQVRAALREQSGGRDG
jgi:hypothetical protein